MKRNTSKARQREMIEFRALHQNLRQALPNLCRPVSARSPAVGSVHTLLDLLLWIREHNPKVASSDGKHFPETQVLLTQRKNTPYWTWEEYKSGSKKLDFEPGFFYVANTLYVEWRDSVYWKDKFGPAKWAELSRAVQENLQASCIRTNETRAFPTKTDFVFCDFETNDTNENRVVPTVKECAALLGFCRKHGAFACGLSPHGLHPVLLFDREVCVADPDPTREMQRAVLWFFKDFQLGRWKLDPPSWTRSRHERGCPLLFWNENARVKLPAILPELPAPPSKSETVAGSGRQRSKKTNASSIPSGQVTNFLGKKFAGSNATARAHESNVCLCGLAGMGLEETTKLTGLTQAHVQETWRAVLLPTLPPNHAAAIRAKIYREGKSLKSKAKQGRMRLNGLPSHWVDAPGAWFNAGEAYVQSSSSFQFGVAQEFFARSFGHSVQAFGDAGYTSEMAFYILHFWMALTDSGLGAHEAMEIARDGTNSAAGASSEFQERSQRCLNWVVSWKLHRLFAVLRKDFADRVKFCEFLSVELRNLAKLYWGKKRKLRPIGPLAIEIIEYGVIQHLAKKSSSRSIRSRDLMPEVSWESIPTKRESKPRPSLKGTNVIDLSAPTREASAKTRMIHRYFKERKYKNAPSPKRGGTKQDATSRGATKQRGSTSWRVPAAILKLAEGYRATVLLQPVGNKASIDIKGHTFTYEDWEGRGFGHNDADGRPASERAGENPALTGGNAENTSHTPDNQVNIKFEGHTLTNGGRARRGWWPKIRRANVTEDLDEILPKVDASRLQDAIWDWSQEEVNECLPENADQDREDENPDWKPIMPPTLLAVCAEFYQRGDAYQPKEKLEELLEKLCHKGGHARPEALLEELLGSGLVVDVTKWVADGNTYFAWRRCVEGEATFARNVISHSRAGGKGEIIFGDPGTGKTHAVAERVIAKSTSGGHFIVVGSAQHNSALTLENRIIKNGGRQRVSTVHSAFGVTVDPEKYGPFSLGTCLLVCDEAGQLDAYTMGAMSSRWIRTSEVLLSIGPNQLYPVGPGRMGEDLIECLKQHGLKGWTLTHLTENHRTKDNDSIGIVDFFTAVKQGKMGIAGPGLELDIRPLSEDWDFTRVMGAIAGIKFKKDVLSFDEPVACFFPLDLKGAEAADEEIKKVFQLPPYRQGEKYRIKHLRPSDYAQKLRKGELVGYLSREGNHFLKVKTLSEEAPQIEVVLPIKNLRSTFCLTGHSAQGMEIDYGAVVVLPSRVTTRRWLYSAISRCRKKCVIVYRASGDGKDDLRDCIARDPQRRTLFPKFFDYFVKKFGI